jgi:hypothetical protein
MGRKHQATRWPRLANPVSAAIRKPAVVGLSSVTLDLQATQAVLSLRDGQPSRFDQRVLESLTFIVSKLARDGIGPEARPCAERCLALLARLTDRGVPEPDQVRAFTELIEWSQAQREADPEAFRAAALPFVR